MTELSRNVLPSESWNSYLMAPGTGDQANDGVREKLVFTGSSARRRKPCRPVGALSADRAEPAATAISSMAASSVRRRAVRIVSMVFRQSWSRATPSDGGCEQPAGGKDERVGSGRPDELDRGGKAALRRATREGEGGPAERVEGEGERDPALADRQLVNVRRRCDEGHRRRDEEVDPLRRLVAAVAVVGAQPPRGLDLLVRHLGAALDLAAHVLPVLVRALGEEAPMHVRDLAHEQAVLAGLAEREVDRLAIR